MTSRPNLLLVVLDTARADHLPPHRLGRRLAPRLAAEVDAGRAVAHPVAYTSAPWTLPSHASLFSGMHPSEHGIHGRSAVRPDRRVATLRTQIEALGDLWLPEALRRSGYRTFGISANPWVSETLGFSHGFEDFVPVGPARLRPREAMGTRRRARDRLPKAVREPLGRLARHAREWRGTGDSGAGRAVEAFGRLIAGGREGHSDDRPWFGFVNLMEAHVPYAPPRAFNELRGPAALRAPSVSRRRRSYEATLAYNLELADLPPGDLDIIRALYRGEIRYLDHVLGRMLDSLRTAGLLSRTAIVVTSDHGEALGEHHRLDHQTTIIEPVIRVPLLTLGPATEIVSGPAERPVSLREIPERLAPLAGLDPAPWRERGRVPEGVCVIEYESTFAHDRRSIIAARRNGWPEAAVARLRAEMAAVVEGTLKLSIEGEAVRLLDLDFDAFEERPASIAGDVALAAEAQRRLNGHLLSARATTAPPPPDEGYDAQQEAEIEERLSQLGYL